MKKETIPGNIHIPGALKCSWRFMIGWNRLFFIFPALFNVPKATAFWAGLTLWMENVALIVTARADHHVVFFSVENLSAHFSVHASVFDLVSSPVRNYVMHRFVQSRKKVQIITKNY